MSQKYQKGDLVHIAKDLGPSMSHFISDVDAIVIGSYAELFGGASNTKHYTLNIKGRGEVSWYEEHQLTLLAKDQLALLDTWEAERSERNAMVSDIDWIFANGDEVLKSPKGVSLKSLATVMGIRNLWGSRGEGIDYYQNAVAVLAFSEPFLRRGDKAGWLTAIAFMRETIISSRAQ